MHNNEYFIMPVRRLRVAEAGKVCKATGKKAIP